MSALVLRLPDVKHRTGLSRSTIYVMVAEGTFPPPLHLGPRAVGWLASEVESWVADKANCRRQTKKVIHGKK